MLFLQRFTKALEASLSIGELFFLAKKNRQGLYVVYRDFTFAKTIVMTLAEGERIFSKMRTSRTDQLWETIDLTISRS